MANMRDIKLRIKSVRDTRQITKAMKLISAAKLKKARQQLEQTLPYFKKVKETMAEILNRSGEIDNIFFDQRDKKVGKKKAYIVFSGDKGLAGGYNTNVYKLTEYHAKEDKDPRFFVAGHMGRSYFLRKNYIVDEEFDYPVQNPTTIRALEMCARVISLFKSGEIDEVYLVYTEMISSLKLEPRMMKLLPLEIDAFSKEIDMEKLKSDKPMATYTYEPSPTAVLNVLVPKYVKGILYGAMVEAFTSEQSARMTAMDNATNNADEMLGKLKLNYNRARQAAITQEISEIVGGAAAIE